MPKYDYKCKKCNSNFYITCGINDPRENITCTECGSKDIARIFNVIVLKGQRARGYQDDSKEAKPADNVTEKAPESKETDKITDNETKKENSPTVAPAEIKHDHCSPEQDYL